MEDPSRPLALGFTGAGADKVSIGSDAVDVAKAYIASGRADGSTSIEQISYVYGRQAVVVSIDPRRRWVASAAAAGLQPLTAPRGPAGERRNSRELPPASRDRFCSQPCTSGAATARFGRLGPAAAAFCRLLQQQRVIAIWPVRHRRG